MLGLSLLAGGANGPLPEGGAVRFESCAGWGLCTFRLAGPAAGQARTLRVRLRGVGNPAQAGTCAPEREAARTIRRFVEGILTRATRIELTGVEPRSDGAVLATVRVDGTDVVDILVHIGLGWALPLAPAASWCD